LKIGLLINPWAGIGGQVALKGSDGQAIVKEALERGAQKIAHLKVEKCLTILNKQPCNNIHWFCPKGEMGSDQLDTIQATYTLINYVPNHPSTAQDTINIATEFLSLNLDLILFAGGDGTARDLYSIIQDKTPVLGIPAGVKIHSSVYALTPEDAARCIIEISQDSMLQIAKQEVRDINETLFRQGKVQAKFYGEMLTPQKPEYIQAVKMGGVESDELLNEDIAHFLMEEMDQDTLYFIGSGKTLDCLMQNFKLPNTLLGVDAIYNQTLIQSDLTAEQILDLSKQYKYKIIISVIGGQGHIFGRGNHQFNADFLQQLQPEQLTVVSNKRKLNELNQKPIIIDSLDNTFVEKLNGRITVLTGYDQWVSYPVR